MGSVIDYIECPNCGTEAYDDFYYKTGEEYISCNNCGYYKSVTIINRDKALNELTEEDWEVVEIKNPYGSYRFKQYGNPGFVCGTLESDEQLNECVAYAQTLGDVEYFGLSRFVDGEIVVKHIIDNKPKEDEHIHN